MGFVECVPRVAWGMNSFSSANCSFFQDCRSNSYSSLGPAFICDCKNSDFLLNSNQFGECHISQSSIVLQVFFGLLVCTSTATLFLFERLRVTAKRRKLMLIHDLVTMTMASTVFLLCRCVLLVVRMSDLSIADNSIISGLYICSILGMLLSLAMSVMIYGLLILSVSNSSKVAAVLTEEIRRRMRKSILRSGVLYGSGACLVSGFPYIFGLWVLSHALAGVACLCVIALFFVILARLNQLFKSSTKHGWRIQTMHELRKSMIVVMLSIGVFFLCTVIYVSSWFLGHEFNNAQLTRHGLALSVLMEHASANAFQLAIIYVMRSLVRKPANATDNNHITGSIATLPSRGASTPNNSSFKLILTPPLPQGPTTPTNATHTDPNNTTTAAAAAATNHARTRSYDSLGRAIWGGRTQATSNNQVSLEGVLVSPTESPSAGQPLAASTNTDVEN